MKPQDNKGSHNYVAVFPLLEHNRKFRKLSKEFVAMTMNWKRMLLMLLSLTILIYSLPNIVFGEEKSSVKSIYSSNTAVGSGLTEESIVREAQRSLDRAINVLNIVATLLGVLVGVLTLIFVLGSAWGFLEFRKVSKLREQMEKYRDEARKAVEEVREEAEKVKPIVERIKKTEEEVNNLRKEITPSLITEALSEALKKKLDKYGEKIRLLELFGIPLKFEDYYNRGIEFYFKGKYEEALESFNKVIELKPDFAKAWFNKSVILGKLARYNEALEACDKAIQLSPDFAEAWNNKGAILGELGKYKEALEAINKAIELKPDYPDAWYNKACIYIP